MAYVQNVRSKERLRQAKELGVQGERMAAKYIEDNGCVIIECNYRNRRREVVSRIEHVKYAFNILNY